MRLLKLPFGNYLNIELAKTVRPTSDHAAVDVWFGGDPKACRYEGEDAAAMLAPAERAID
jgi:hypothetical protein